MTEKTRVQRQATQEQNSHEEIASGVSEASSALRQLQSIPRPPATAIQSLQRTLGNAAVQRLLIQRNDDPYEEEPAHKTGYLGFNPGARREANVLKGRLKDDAIIALNDPTTEANLQTDEGIAKWLYEVLGIDIMEDMSTFNCLKKVDPAARDMMAQAIKMFYAAEKGDYHLERLILSGHSNGIELWGDDSTTQNSGRFVMDQDLVTLAEIFPKAAAQVEDVMFSACFSYTSIDLVVRIFPNLKNAWGYLGYSPSAEFDAPEHIALFEEGTHGDKTLKKESGRGASALWTRDAKDQGGTGMIRNDISQLHVDELLSDYKNAEEDYQAQFEGKSPLNSNLNGLYSLVQYLLLHPGTPRDMIPTLNDRRDILLRLRHYTQISARFHNDYKSEIDQAYTTLSRPRPGFNNMSRAKLKQEMAEFKAALDVENNPTSQRFYDTYLSGLWSLTDQNVIPTSWI